MRTCGIIPPNYFDDLGSARTDCPLPAGHLEPHQSVTARRGLIEWADDYECDCCHFDEGDRCIWWRALAPAALDASPATTDELRQASCEATPPQTPPRDQASQNTAEGGE